MECRKFLLLFVLWVLFISKISLLSVGCREEERQALLSFKRSLDDKDRVLYEWKDGDCCKWKGVACNNTTGYVIKLSIGNLISYGESECFTYNSHLDNSLSALKHLQYLDLSHTCYNSTSMPRFISSLTSLTFLNLSKSNFAGTIPSYIGNLTNLRYLDLSYSYSLRADNLQWLSHFFSLQYLDMSSVNLTDATDWMLVFKRLPALSVLHLSHCGLQNLPSAASVPQTNLSSISILDLAGNFYPNAYKLESLFNLSSSLVNLDLSSSNLYGPIPHAFGNLLSLKSLNLAENSLNGSIPESLGQLTLLEDLNLGYNSLQGSIPKTLGNLTNLQYLDLSSYFGSLHDDSLHWLTHLSSLKYLDMSGANLTDAIDWLLVFRMLPALSVLRLSSCGLRNFPTTSSVQSIGLSTIETLDLGYNPFFNATDLDWLLNLRSSLVHLDLNNCSIHGSIPQALGNLSSLESISLDSNFLQGPIPGTLGNLNNLKTLSLSDNKISGSLPDWIGKMRNLQELFLSNNNLSGSIPVDLGQLSELVSLHLGLNAFEGIISDSHFANMTKLEYLSLALNHLAVNISSKWVPAFQLIVIDLSSCQLGPQFPSWLQKQREFVDIDISNAGISDKVPDWFWNASSGVYYLNISDNQIRGEVSMNLKFHNATIIDMSWNQFQGQLPHVSTNARYLLLHDNLFSGDLQPVINLETRNLGTVVLSKNRLSGQIPSSICKWENLVILDLSYNDLSGEIPNCQANALSSLTIINLASNNLSGSIPKWMGYLSMLKLLHLGKNIFNGEFPSLRKCSQMITLDLGENKFTGSIPAWVGYDLPLLRFLRLRSNKLNGTIPLQLSYLTSLQLLDLSHNDLSGQIPRSFKNFSAMKNLNSSTESIINLLSYDQTIQTSLSNFAGSYFADEFAKSFEEMLDVVVKGRELQYTKTLHLVVLLDLSFNNLTGEVPTELMNLVGLQSLNLSGNQLIGNIPVKIGSLTSLETLDLSRNNLSGPIPWSVTLLTSLSHLNLSYNNLSGRIPSGNQLQTLIDTSIYDGNQDLCGFPLPRACPGDESLKGPLPVGGEDNNDDLGDLYLGMGVGFAVGLWGVYGILLSRSSWRNAYFRFIDDMAKKISMAK